MIYVLQDKYYEEGFYECKRNVCAFTSAKVAKEIEIILAFYLEKYDDCVETPNGYFDVLKANKDEIIQKFSKVLNSDINAKKLFNKLNLKKVQEWHRYWKTDGLWFKVVELSEF